MQLFGSGNGSMQGWATAHLTSPSTPSLWIAAADPLSQQALEVQAQDLALEDTLYALDKALNSNNVEPDVYLRQASCPMVRVLHCDLA